MGISLDAEATDWLWLNPSLDEEDLLSDQKEKLIQKETKAKYTLKKNTTYYIRIRYVGKDGVSKWTKAKKVKTKK